MTATTTAYQCIDSRAIEPSIQSPPLIHPKQILAATMPQATATVNGVEVARASTWEIVDGNIYVRAHPSLPLQHSL